MREKAKPFEACTETHSQLSYACSVHNSFEACLRRSLREVLPMSASRSANRTSRQSLFSTGGNTPTFALQSNQRVRKQSSRTKSGEEIKLAADSGATDTVMPPGDLPSIELREGAP